MYTLRFDGLYKKVVGGNHAASRAGFMCYGWLIFKNGILIARGHGVFARGTDASSNIAEYLALIEGLEALSDMGVRTEPVLVMGDAKSVIDQMTGEAAVNATATRPLYKRARNIVRDFHSLTWCWTPRQFNRDADKLTRRAMSQIRSDWNEYQAAVEAITPGIPGKAPNHKMLSLVDFRVYHLKGETGVAGARGWKSGQKTALVNGRRV